MKGILLAGGKGTRLYPLTKTISKQLLPVYDKPMIYYPLSTLMLFGIKDILIISTPHDTPNIQQLFGDGAQLGLKLHYAIQPEPQGIAQAFMIGADFIGNDQVCLILGDNIFYMGDHIRHFVHEVQQSNAESEQQQANDENDQQQDHAGAERQHGNAIIFAYHVSNPQRFGVVEFDAHNKAISIEEKPRHPKSNYVSVGLYFYPPDVVTKAQQLTPSQRGEYEITDLNNAYLQEDRLTVLPMQRGNAWLDAGTPDSLMDSSIFVQLIEKRQGLKLACLEEIAYQQGFITKDELAALINELSDSTYKTYLNNVLTGDPFQ